MQIKRVLRAMSRILPDKWAISLDFYRHMGKFPDLKNPKTFNEKLQWLKLHDRKPEYTQMVDKYKVREYIAQTVGEEYLIPLLGVWENVKDIDFDALPDQFVLKCNHNSGLGMCICKDKSKLDIPKAKRELAEGLAQNYYLHSREWPYKDVPRRIIAEQYMTDETGTQLKDYKVFCFDGIPHYVQVDFDRFSGHKKNIYTLEWKLVDFSFNYPSHPEIEIARPIMLEKMVRIAQTLSVNKPYARIDFYSIGTKLYIGEITFFPASGYGKFIPEEYDRILGDMIRLPVTR